MATDAVESNVSGQRTGPRRSTSILSSSSSDADSTVADSVSSPIVSSTARVAEAKPPVNGATIGLKSQLAEVRRRIVEMNDPERRRRVRDDLLKHAEEERQKRKAELHELMAETRRMVEDQQRRQKAHRAREKELEVRLRHQEDTWADEIKSLHDEVMDLRMAEIERRTQATTFVSAEAATMAVVEAKQLEGELQCSSPRPSSLNVDQVEHGSLLDEHLQVLRSAVSRLSPTCREHLQRARERLQQQRADVQKLSKFEDAITNRRTSDGSTEFVI